MKLKLSRIIAGALLSVFAIGASFALQVDQTRIMSARSYQDYHPIYYRMTVNYNDSGIGSGQLFGRLSQNTFIKAIDCHVTTAFNASTTNVLTFGTTTTATEIVGSSDINELSATVQHLTSAIGLGLNATSAADVNLYAKFAQTGTAATAGAATCVIEFVPNNDM